MEEKVRVGIIGCGAISGNYLRNAQNLPVLEIAACADLDLERAKARAEEFSIPKACSVEELLADRSIEMVLNLTIPGAHAPVALDALSSDKHVYNEKPLATEREGGKQVMKAAHAKGMRVGCAPDTFLGAGLQTCRKLIDDGAIGRPVAFTAFVLGRGPESFHPNPQFFYEPGGGPMFDMGPYYLTALLNLLGPVRRIGGIASIAIPERTIGSEPLKGQTINVKTPDHVCGVLEFEGGAVGTLMTSFATMFGAYDYRQPITIYGTEGTLKVPDPNGFDGPVHLRCEGDKEWREMPHTFATGYGRSVGLADMAYAVRSGRPHRASGEQGLAVLDLMEGFLDASREGETIAPSVPYHRPAPMPTDLPFGTLDA